MPRNIDMTALRSFVAVADCGGVTRAAGILNLTQSAVSMQLRRLEDSLGLTLMDRSGRTIGLTAAGEQLLGYGHRILALNDEVFARLTAQEFSGEIRLGVPHDIVDPYVPRVLRAFSTEFPRVRVQLISAPTLQLRDMFDRGACDVIITTEAVPGPEAETLTEIPLAWVGAIGGTAWRTRPLRLAYCSNCVFRPGVIRALEQAEIAWELVVESDGDSAVNAAVSADLAVQAVIRTDISRQHEEIAHGGALPDLGRTKIAMYAQGGDAPVLTRLSELVRATYGQREPAMA
ncbi:DNA-binding transcriptional regulator, LysR family [Loktanella sp. DSM 29012]|uniref:LysR family transcriptional regulator n=1 Tax=Loktanella sp. DSM 29012 TaxID=1881056 RepID=UPI0008D04857|nr:LysR family transcriptional regulator [Loktanella sp. DSM 29012]SEQ05557.1 DNA-binding transcriptional regulator, LysR family [Loktanella sp. DSM 29012]